MDELNKEIFGQEDKKDDNQTKITPEENVAIEHYATGYENYASHEEAHQGDSYQDDSYQSEAYKDDSYQSEAYKDDSYQRKAYQGDSYQREAYQGDSYQRDAYQGGYGYSYQNTQYMNGYANSNYPYPEGMNYGYAHPDSMNPNYTHPADANTNYVHSTDRNAHDASQTSQTYHSHNVNGMEAMYISQNMTNAEEAAKHADQNYGFGSGAELGSGYGIERTVPNMENEIYDGEYLNKLEVEKPHVDLKKKEMKTEKKGGKRFAKLVAAAAIFGLVAATVFQGVRYGSDALIAKKQGTKEAETSDRQDQNISDHQNTPYIEASSNSVQTVNYDVSNVAENVMPSIVSITGTYVQTYQYWFTTYEQELPGAGSGIIIGRDDEYLFILTNCHVVEGAKELEVVFVDDESVDAIVKGTDADNDVAIVLVPLEDIKEETLNQIKEITVGSSDNLKIGDPCIAIGNALGYGQSVTVGYISALEREITVSDGTISVLQTDAAINPGNSGGALVNMNGELIGVNTAKGIGSNVEGMGYALPISDISDIINELLAAEGIQEMETNEQEPVAGNTIEPGQTYLGISASTIDKEYAEMLDMPEGIYISTITRKSPAEVAGLKSGDIIVGFDGEEVKDMTVLQGKVAAMDPGDEVEIEFYRLVDEEYEKQTVTATLQAKE